MKLLFDENLSPRLVQKLATEFPESAHISSAGLRGAEDRQIWDYARNTNYVIISKDTDFRERSYVDGHPPKVIWLDVGNAGSEAIEDLLRNELQRMESFINAEESSLLILSLGPQSV